MFKSTLYRLLFVVCFWLCALFLQCCALDVTKEQMNQQTKRHCRKNCFYQMDALMIMTQLNAKISSRQSCYEECLRTFGKQDFLGNEQINTLSKRIKRDVLESQTNSNPYTNETANWTGYKLIYVPGYDKYTYNCQDLEKNITSIILKNGSFGWMVEEPIRFKVLSLPLVNGDNVDIVQRLDVKLSKQTVFTSSPTTDGVFTSSPTADGVFTSSTSTDGVFTFSPTTVGSPPSLAAKVTDNKTKDHKVAIGIGVSVAAGVIFAAVALYFVYRRRRSMISDPTEEISMIQRNNSSSLQFEYDVFIIYSSKDEKWVNKTLLQTLEKKHGLTCCIHYRNFTPGVLYRKNMVDSVYKCRKTVAVVSKNFFTSGFCETEMEYALRRLIERNDDSLVVIRLDDVDTEKLPLELKPRSYIDCPRTVERKTWEKKLVDCLKVTITENETAIL